MIILSQNNRNIVNFERINLIGTDGEGCMIAKFGIDDVIMLGSYITEERAQKILEDIVEIHRVAIPTAEYKMPKE